MARRDRAGRARQDRRRAGRAAGLRHPLLQESVQAQATAIFLFITDKQYFDLVEGRIDTARRQRTYAIEHTFFTHRVFVRRPGLEDCLRFLKEVTAFDSGDTRSSFHADVDAVGKHDKRVRRLEEMKPLEQFVRLLLYRSQYHFFDLKTVMRQYVQDDAGRVYLRANDTTVPRSDRALASFRFPDRAKACVITASSVVTTRMKACRTVCSLSSMTCTRPSRSRCRDSTRAKPTTTLEPDQRRAVDHLDLYQRQAIEKAVDELVDDLALGQAAEVVASGQPGAVLTWRKERAAALPGGGPPDGLRTRGPAPGEADGRSHRLVRVTRLAERCPSPRSCHQGQGRPDSGRARSFDDSQVAPSREQVAKQVIDCEVQTAPLVEELTRRHLEELQSTWGLTPVSGPDLAFSFMEGTAQQPPRGLLLYETFSSGEPGRSLEPRLQDSESLAVVIVALDDQASRASLLANTVSTQRRGARTCW